MKHEDIPHDTQRVAIAIAAADGRDPHAWTRSGWFWWRESHSHPVWVDYVDVAAAAIRAMDA